MLGQLQRLFGVRIERRIGGRAGGTLEVEVETLFFDVIDMLDCELFPYSCRPTLSQS